MDNEGKCRAGELNDLITHSFTLNLALNNHFAIVMIPGSMFDVFGDLVLAIQY